MSTCEIKTGMFVLQECGNEATTTCSGCGKAICRDHSHFNGPAVHCLECLGSGNTGKPGNNVSNKHNNNSYTDTNDYFLWYYATRHTFFAGHQTYTPFNSHDIKGFEQETNQEFNDENDSGNFLDS